MIRRLEHIPQHTNPPKIKVFKSAQAAKRAKAIRNFTNPAKCIVSAHWTAGQKKEHKHILARFKQEKCACSNVATGSSGSRNASGYSDKPYFAMRTQSARKINQVMPALTMYMFQDA
jgi:hypothetical protein